MKKETKALIIATILLMPVYGAICYALYWLDVMSKDTAICCFIIMLTTEHIINGFKKSNKE